MILNALSRPRECIHRYNVGNVGSRYDIGIVGKIKGNNIDIVQGMYITIGSREFRFRRERRKQTGVNDAFILKHYYNIL